VQTGELQPYGERHSFDAKPVWLAAKQTVAFTDLAQRDIVLRINREGGVPVSEAATGLMAPYLAVSPGGQKVLFFTQAMQMRPEVFDVVQAQRLSLSFTLPWSSWQDLRALGQQFGPEPYRANWHPLGNQVAFYNDTGFYLVDLPSGQICEVDLGFEEGETRYGKRWTFDVQWSPNGRYLAALTTVGDPPVHFVDLTLIDTNTGERRRLDLGLQYLYTIAWAPNSYDLLIVAEKSSNESGLVLHGLYVVNVITGDERQMLADYQFVSTGAWGVAWSPTGQEIALACPVVAPEEQLMEGRLCIITVEVRR
jgi:Tol biopolymer transport system component